MLALAAACTSPNEPSSTGAIDTGTYPNLNIKPKVANTQFTAAQTTAKTRELNRARSANSRQRTPPPNDIPLLRKIGQEHAKKAIDEIEGKQP